MFTLNNAAFDEAPKLEQYNKRTTHCDLCVLSHIEVNPYNESAFNYVDTLHIDGLV